LESLSPDLSDFLRYYLLALLFCRQFFTQQNNKAGESALSGSKFYRKPESAIRRKAQNLILYFAEKESFGQKIYIK